VELGRHPAEQDAMAKALDGYSGPGVPKRVEWVVDETLRLWPSGFVGRRATRDINCAGWLVPAKTEVMVPLWTLHRLARCFPEPDEFIPDRWATASPQLGEYVPFGGGSHRCFGQRFGRAQMCTALAAIISRCRVTLTGDVEPADPLSVLRPAGCGLTVTPR
jgi:cytochrome P450